MRMRVLLSLAIAFTLLFDWGAEVNATHVWNPQWHAHARFHAVWQLATQLTMSVVALGFIWARRSATLLLAGIVVAACESVGFIVSFALRPLFDSTGVASPSLDISLGGVPLNLAVYVALLVLYLACAVRVRRAEV
jgi:hypothetical protein